MLAHVTKTEELALDQEEAANLAKGIANVARHYSVQASQVSLDWANLAMTLIMVYGTRGVAIKNNRKKKPKSPERAPNVIDMTAT